MLFQSTWASRLDADEIIIKWDGNLTTSQYLFDKDERAFYFSPKLNKTQALERLVEEDKITMFGAQNCEVKKGGCAYTKQFCQGTEWSLGGGVFSLEASLGVSSEVCSGYEHSCSEDGKQTWTELYYNMLRERVTGKYEWGRTCMGYPSFGTRNFDVTITWSGRYECKHEKHSSNNCFSG
ncbi:hypothetical protein CU097_013008 [Rhizopus azygosporus]|uniref:Uncharacterized protein n=1 Tax=Rhizopus azygosporus TaxID=86630 RepID=A0A367JZC2_RHIAZ|nr:hypothetical protein CU097_013008 [Rhizopus azygosporus]